MKKTGNKTKSSATKILVLGIGNAQLDLIEKCRALGLNIIACSNTDHGPGREFADVFAGVDVTDINGVEALARSHDVDLIYSIGSDVAMPTVSHVSERLGLPAFVDSKTAAICNSKPLLRDHLGTNFRGNIVFEAIKEPDQATLSEFPLVMKPADSQGQRGVRVVSCMEEIRSQFLITRAFSRSGEVILERFVDGPEVSVNAYSSNGEIVFFAVSDRICWNQFTAGLIHRHRVPSSIVNHDIQSKIYDLTKRALKKLNIGNGPSYLQIKIEDGEPYLIEITPRLDGCHMWRLLRYHTSVDLLDATVQHLLGKTPAMALVEQWQGTNSEGYSLEFLCDLPGRPMNSLQFKLNNPICVCWYFKDGEIITSLNGLFEKCGYYISANNGDE